MKKLFCILLPLIVCMLSACDSKNHDSKPNIEFIIDSRIKTTPVKDQGRSTLCWIYAMLATIESDRLMIGDSVNLSVDYLARMMLSNKATKTHFSQRPPSMRGMMTMTPQLMEQYGMMPYDSYHADKPANYMAIARKMAKLGRIRSSISTMQENVDDLLDREIGYLPYHIYMLGAEYSPQEFAHSIYQSEEWQAITSFTHHPYGEEFELETPDNMMHDKFLNVPLDSMMTYIVRSLKQGIPVCWEGDISEKGFDMESGIATLDNKNDNHETITHAAALRQKAFELRSTTDDHCMALVGLAHDKQGKRYIIAKNSWGAIGRYHGYIFMSEQYIKMKTIAVMVKKEICGNHCLSLF